MSLIIEDGKVPLGANSYVSVDRLRAFAGVRTFALPESESACEALLLSAVDYLETIAFAGQRSSPNQALSWPRTGVVVDGVAIAANVVPEAICRAQMALAVEAHKSPLMASARSSAYSRAKIGDIEVQYRNSDEIAAGASVQPKFPLVEALLAPYLVCGGRSMTRSVRV